MNETKTEQFKMARPPLPQSRESHHRTSVALEKTERTEKDRDNPEYRDHSVKQKQVLRRELTEATNETEGAEQLIKRFDEYQPESEFDIERLRKSEHIKIKRYKGCNYFGEIMNDKRQGLGIMLYQSGRVYEGEWEGGAKHGKGYERFSNGSKYTGSFVNGKPEGFGTFRWPNHEVYEGMWVNGQKHGSGMWTGARGDSYIGEWKFGMTDGYGVHTWINGDKYEGQFKSCLKHGEGVEKFANGDKYVGNYVNGKPDGYGEYTWSNESFFKGNFKNGLRHGHGVWKKGSGECDQYQGEYVNDKKCGYGIFSWAGGNIYKGHYFEDLRHGYGEMYWADDTCYKGNWQKGVQHGQGELVEGASNIKKGIFSQNMMVIEEENADAVQVNKSPIVQGKSFRTKLSMSTSRNLGSTTKMELLPIDRLATQEVTVRQSTSRSKILNSIVSQHSIKQKSVEKLKFNRRASQDHSLSHNKSPCARCTSRHQKEACKKESSKEKTSSFYIRSTRLTRPPKPTDKDSTVQSQLNTSTNSKLSAINKKRMSLYATNKLLTSKENEGSINGLDN